MVTVVTCNSLNSQKFDSQRNIFKSIINEKGKTLFPEKLKKRCWFEMKTCILLSIYHVLFDSLIHLLSKTIFQKFKLGGGGYNCYKIGYGLLGITQKHEQDLGSFHLKVSTPRKKTYFARLLFAKPLTQLLCPDYLLCAADTLYLRNKMII